MSDPWDTMPEGLDGRVEAYLKKAAKLAITPSSLSRRRKSYFIETRCCVRRGKRQSKSLRWNME